jgi:hypothetical protein
MGLRFVQALVDFHPQRGEKDQRREETARFLPLMHVWWFMYGFAGAGSGDL